MGMGAACADIDARIEPRVVATERETLDRRLGGVLVSSPEGRRYIGEGGGEGSGMSEAE